MNTSLVSALRLAALSTALVAFAALAHASDTANSDRASALLSSHSSVAVANAGPYVNVGTYQIQVAVKLGRPSAKLADGTWLYSNFGVENSAANGTLVVQFGEGRVSGLKLVTPAVATAMLATLKSPDRVMVASRN